MIRVLLISHAYMSEGVASSAELILGPQQNLSYLTAYVEEPFEIELRKILNEKKEEDKLVIITDLLGGSVNNEVMTLLKNYRDVRLITGMNLMLVISVLLANEDNFEEELGNIIQQSREGIIYFDNDKEIEDTNLDEF